MGGVRERKVLMGVSLVVMVREFWGVEGLRVEEESWGRGVGVSGLFGRGISDFWWGGKVKWGLLDRGIICRFWC